jgi:hypothetical protein
MIFECYDSVVLTMGKILLGIFQRQISLYLVQSWSKKEEIRDRTCLTMI